MRIALIAHDKKKDDMIEFVRRYRDIFEEHQLFATGTTGRLLEDIVDLKVKRFLSGPLGGDQQIGGRIAEGKIDFVIFLRDPLTPQPHEPDVISLIRICDVHCVPVATNIGSAEVFLSALKRK
ncbi:methylglyoxal synthase [Clostridium sp.]|uniref:methylglyoxal synthase n=1 Tax=Clostridium sp. TaxID=1506 RepID=UPI00346460F9